LFNFIILAGKDMTQGLPHFDVSTFLPQIFWLIIFFSALYYVLSKVALPKIGMQLKARQEYIDSILQDAFKIKTEIESIKVSNDERLSVAKKEAQKIILEAEENAKKSILNTELEEINKLKADIDKKKIDLNLQLKDINIDFLVNEVSDFILDKIKDDNIEKRLRKVS
jgi:F-type H+-transporting ATPase subunit b